MHNYPDTKNSHECWHPFVSSVAAGRKYSKTSTYDSIFSLKILQWPKLSSQTIAECFEASQAKARDIQNHPELIGVASGALGLLATLCHRSARPMLWLGAGCARDFDHSRPPPWASPAVHALQLSLLSSQRNAVAATDVPRQRRNVFSKHRCTSLRGTRCSMVRSRSRSQLQRWPASRRQ